MRQRFLMMSVCLALVSLAGCGGSTEDQLVGEYTEGESNLKVTGDTLTMSEGPMALTVNYKVIKTEGNTVTMETTMAGDERKITLPVTIVDNGIEIGGDGEFEGKWVRK